MNEAKPEENPNYTPPRRVEVLRGDAWLPATFPELVPGDRVRMFENDGGPPAADDGEVWVVMGRATERPELPGRYRIQSCSVAEWEKWIADGGRPESLL